MDDDALDLLFSGDLSNLVSLPKRVVRLFISSTFTDMTLERNSLMERVYPKLKKYCRERHGLDFQVVDMRWGVRDEATDDHQTVDLCSREIANCQRVSLGPNFVAFIGDKYGFRPLPNRIRSTEYRALRRSLLELDINTDFLDTWYREDSNAAPAEYVLQPISSILKNFTNRNEPELQMVDQRIWQAIQDRLHELLAIGSGRLVRQGRMSERDQLMRYSISVTEREVIEGCLDVSDAKLRCLVFSRSILDLDKRVAECLVQQTTSCSMSQLDASGDTGGAPISSGRRDSVLRKASLKIGDDTISLATSGAQTAAERRVERVRRLIGRYIDLALKDGVWRLDTDAQKALANLNTKLRSKLSPNGKNLTIYKVHWDEQDGMSSKLEDHKHYLSDLNERFYSSLTRMIRSAVKREQSKVNVSGLVGEVLRHSHYARQVGKTVHGRAEELEQIRAYILTNDRLVLPMFVYGVGGVGKTSVLVRAATLAQEWILGKKSRPSANDSSRVDLDQKWNRKPCIIMRFCCTTPNSSTMAGVLTSVCMQLQFNFYQFGPLNGMVSQQDEAQLAGAKSDLEHHFAHQQLPYRPIPEDFVRLVFTFRQLLDNCQHQFHRRRIFVIVLDSIERLSSAEASVESKYSWLTSIASLPPNVRLIVSCGSDEPSTSDDYRHLKRHFLQVHFERARAQQQTRPGDRSGRSESGASSGDQFEPLDGAAIAYSAASSARYTMIKRLVVPAMRLRLRANSELGSSHHQSVVHFNETSPSRWSVSGSRLSGARPSGAGCVQLSGDIRHLGVDSVPDQRSASWMLHVRPLGLELARAILGCWLADLGRSLTQQQWCVVERSLSRCSRPIFVKLALGEVANWKSYSTQGDTRGLAFGSAWLGARKPANGACNPGAHLERLVEGREDTGDDLFKWHLLSFEQQWLNYLDWRQRAEQRASAAASQASERRQDVVIQIGAGGGVSLGTQAGGGANPTGASHHHSGAGSAATICHLSDTIEDMICQLFARIELQHGYLLTKHSLSYITAARNGISENELEDILSLDDVVLDDVFQYHLPPVRRIPPLLWTRIRNDLPDYLSERDADGIVVAWHHSQFRAVTQERYLADSRQRAYIHSTMADYFLGRWADKAKPFRCTRQQIQMAAEQLESAFQSSARDSQSQQRASLSGAGRLGSGAPAGRPGASFSARSRLRSSDQHDQRLQWLQAKADRRVPHQPLFYLAASGYGQEARPAAGAPAGPREAPAAGGGARDQRRRYNVRKLTELPHHLMRARRFADLATSVLFNYRWLFAALDALGLQSLFADFDEALDCIGRVLAERRLAEPAAGDQGAAAVQPRQEQVAGQPEELDAPALESMVDQLRALSSTLRLSSSVLHSDKQMLAAQLIGRLLPVAGRHETQCEPAAAPKSGRSLLGQLLDQCDRHGSSDCALLPTDHCLQSADGLLLSSLEGHAFAVMSVAVSADQRHLLAVSNRFVMWDISTGEVARDVDPKIAGSIMKQLKMGASNEFAVAYTSDDLVLALDILTQQVAKYDATQAHQEHIIGLELVDTFRARRFIVWMRTGWLVLRIDDETRWAPAAARDQSTQRISIQLESAIELASELGPVGWLLDVKIDSTAAPSELVFATTASRHANGQLELITAALPLARQPAASARGQICTWPGRVQCAVLAMASSLGQLVFVDATGSVYLCRRRRSCWSKPKLIRAAAMRAPPGRRRSDVFSSSTDSRLNPVPLAIGLASVRCSSGAPNRHDPLELLDFSRRLELAEFERDIEQVQQDGETQTSFVFHLAPQADQAARGGKRRGRTQHSDAICFVELYFPNKITVLRLDTGSAAGRRHEACLILPLDVLNVSVELNKCQVTGVVVPANQQATGEGGHVRQDHYFIAAAARKLLIYSLEGEQLLRCIDAHSGRITELRPIILAHRPGVQQKSAAPEHGLSLASASMDRTVKIWNLANVDKADQAIDRLDHSIESVCLASQRPLAACLARGELGIWDWRTMRLVARLSASQLADETSDPHREPMITKCKFSSSSQYLFVATTTSIQLLAVGSPAGTRGSSVQPVGELELTQTFRHSLSSSETVQRVKFIAQDSRLLLVLGHPSSPVASSQRDSLASETQDETSSSYGACAPDAHPLTRLTIVCHSIPDGRQLFAVECLSPTFRAAGESQYLSSGASRPLAGACQPGGAERVRVPVVTYDQQTVVVVEPGRLDNAAGSRRCAESLPTEQRVALAVYSTRDGRLVRSIDLGQVAVADQTQRQQQQLAAGGPSGARVLGTLAAVDSTGRPMRAKPGGRPAAPMGSRPVSIGGEQISRLKSVPYLERQSVVAMMDDEKGSSFLLDVSTGQVVACSNSWAGKSSSDGRYGLTRMSKSVPLASTRPAGGQASASLTSGGLLLLEMRRCRSVKSLLSLGGLAGPGESEVRPAGSESDFICGFTKPNDSYVYCYDSCLKRLHLIRLRDSQLIANYKLSTPATKIRCSSDGLALVLGLSDGSLTSLAIVDPQVSDSLARLAHYPSRRRS